MSDVNFHPTVLIVDDEPSMRKMLSIALKRNGYHCETAQSGEAALEFLEHSEVDIVISDMRMGGMNGLELLEKLKKHHPLIEFLLITAHGTIETAIEAVRGGAFDFIQKPFKVAEIELAVDRAMDQINLRRENESLRKEVSGVGVLGNLIGNSVAIKTVMDLVRRSAPSRSNVLVSGESGTGKEVVARTLHMLSQRSSGPFLAVNCGAIPGELLESELFGHIKGSFTGAATDKAGLFQAAKGGTILLDEIGEMPVLLQVKLLRALQERRVRPVGSTREIDVDVRIIASTNRNLSDEVTAGNFREDLYYRLNVIHIEIPPLRERKEDILPLTDLLLGKLCGEMAMVVPEFSPGAKNFLQSYDYPGNVRELENILERGLVLDVDGTLDSEDLIPTASGEFRAANTTLDEKLNEFEKKHILEALNKNGWNRTQTSADLGISFRSLRYRMEKLGLGQ
ncbi:MAG: sigma-54-dependent Fis family transcriptional regulator [Deltaproteobacteria bacterium]|nr:sigma-54-dependent Fis family transcriptional regulator [Deltaproteobacteria bacterium]